MIDETDREILRALVHNARLSNVELGRKVGLSPNAAGVRVQRLVDRGVIAGFRAVIDHAELGRPMEVDIDVWLDDDRDSSRFAATVTREERIIECFHLTGPLDFRVRARVASADDLNDLLKRLKEEGGTRQTDSRFILEQLPVHTDPS
ncbi:MAG: Lrp/AsnC family transcriptional regulator [Actinomycetota bacterium]